MMDENEQQKRSIDDERYRIPGTNMMNFSFWARENLPHEDHKFAVGDIVVFTATVEITALIRDCDGEPLYRFHDLNGNWSEGHIRAATDEEKDNY